MCPVVKDRGLGSRRTLWYKRECGIWEKLWVQERILTWERGIIGLLGLGECCDQGQWYRRGCSGLGR